MASNSLTNTNISETYVGVLHANGAALPPLPQQEDLYDGFGNKSALKVGRAGAGIDVDGTLGASFKTAIAEAIYPVGSVIFSQDNNNPGTRFTGTSWSQISEGRFIAGTGTGNDGTEAKTIPAGNDATGKYNHQLTTAELPSHGHEAKFSIGGSASLGGDTISPGNSNNGNDKLSNDVVQNTGSNTPHNNMPPSFGLYVWQRTS
jgi:hypothetical protein